MTAIRVAVIGGGLAGSVLANGLLKHPHIDFDVFEAGPEFKEQGLAIGLATNAQEALKRIGSDVHESLQLAGGVATSSSRIIMGEGPEKDAFIFDLESVQRVIHVHRALFLKELLRPVPEHRRHVDKKLKQIVQKDSSLTLHFEDGSQGQYDAVIGCDGIHSTVREVVLVDSPAAIKPVFTGYWDVRTAVPMQVAKDAGIIDPANPSETAWIGDGTFVLHQFINNGELVGCIVAVAAEEGYDGSRWRSPVAKQRLEEALAGRGEFGSQIAKVMLDQPEPFAFSIYESAKAPTYCKGPVCIMGDAAHAMTPWQGSGAGSSMEDAMVLEFLLGQVTDPTHIAAAFKAYDEVRKPRTQRIVASSREVGAAFCGRDPVLGMDVAKLAAGLPQKWEHIWSLDMDQHLEEAQSAFERHRES